MSTTNRTLDVLEALRPLAGDGGRAAATAVGRLLHRDTVVEEVQVLEGPDGAALVRMAGRPGQALVAVAMDVQEPLVARLLLLLPAEEAERVSERLVPDALAGSLDMVGESAIAEMGNIAGSAFVSQLARRIPARLLHGVPRLTRGDARACLDTLAPGAEGPAITVRFGAPETLGVLLLLLDPARLEPLARILDAS